MVEEGQHYPLDQVKDMSKYSKKFKKKIIENTKKKSVTFNLVLRIQALSLCILTLKK